MLLYISIWGNDIAIEKNVMAGQMVLYISHYNSVMQEKSRKITYFKLKLQILRRSKYFIW
jgi:hypothetical protein